MTRKNPQVYGTHALLGAIVPPLDESLLAAGDPWRRHPAAGSDDAINVIRFAALS
jgi:hypothetical protein